MRRLVPIFYGNLRLTGAQTVWLLRFMLQLTTLWYDTLHNNTHEKIKLPLLYRSICYAGIVEMDGQQGSNHPAKNTTLVEPAAGLCGMAFSFPAAPPRQPLRKGLTEGGVAGLN